MSGRNHWQENGLPAIQNYQIKVSLIAIEEGNTSIVFDTVTLAELVEADEAQAVLEQLAAQFGVQFRSRRTSENGA